MIREIAWPEAHRFSQRGLGIFEKVHLQTYTAETEENFGILRLNFFRPHPVGERALKLTTFLGRGGGLQQGDVLLSIGGTNVSRENWVSVLNQYKQGDRIPVTVRRFRRTMELAIELGPPEVYDYRIEELPNTSAQMKTLRAAWLDGK